MTGQEARKALDKAIEFYGDCVKDGDTLEEKCHAEEIVDDAIDVLVLAVHVEACSQFYWPKEATSEVHCGDGPYYCDKAPRRDA